MPRGHKPRRIDTQGNGCPTQPAHGPAVTQSHHHLHSQLMVQAISQFHHCLHSELHSGGQTPRGDTHTRIQAQKDRCEVGEHMAGGGGEQMQDRDTWGPAHQCSCQPPSAPTPAPAARALKCAAEGPCSAGAAGALGPEPPAALLPQQPAGPSAGAPGGWGGSVRHLGEVGIPGGTGTPSRESGVLSRNI